MAGLLARPMDAAPPMEGKMPEGDDGADMAPPMEGEGEEQPNVSPEEQKAYNQFVANGMKVIFAEKTAPAIIGRLKASQAPVEGLAAATVMVVDRLQQSAKAKGADISPDILLHGGIELMGNIAELASAAKIHDFTPDEQEQALYMALDQYGTMAAERGDLDKEGVVQDFKTMIEADKAGKIDEVLPGLSEKAAMIKRQKGGKEAPAAEPVEDEE